MKKIIISGVLSILAFGLLVSCSVIKTMGTTSTSEFVQTAYDSQNRNTISIESSNTSEQRNQELEEFYYKYFQDISDAAISSQHGITRHKSDRNFW